MHPQSHVWTRFTAAMALLLGLLATISGGNAVVAQTGNSSIEVHERICPVGYEGEDFFGDCHDTIPDPGMPFTFTNEDTGETWEGTTNENGNVGFANLPEGTYTIIGGAPGEFAEHVIYCAVGTADHSDQEQIPVEYVAGGAQFYLPADTNVICDWYEIPYDLQGEPAENPFDLPIYTLLCDDDPGAAVTDFVMGGVLPDGCEQYGGAQVSISTLAGDPYGTCETGMAGPCYVTVDIGGSVLATIDTTTLPAGYAPFGGEMQEVDIPPASEAWVLFVAVPVMPEPTVAPPTPTVEVIPVEGRDVVIHEGVCGAVEPGAVVVELTDLTAPDTDAMMDVDVIVAETSSTVIDLTLDELMASEHAIIAYSDDDARTPVACTVIGGELNDNGELVLGLQEVDDSGFAGIVYLRDSDQGAAISVFLAEGLAEDESEATPAPLG
jgi:hypothetical protein